MREAALKDGMKPLRISGAMKIAAGLTREFSVLSSRDQLALARICKRLGVGRAAPVTG